MGCGEYHELWQEYYRSLAEANPAQPRAELSAADKGCESGDRPARR